MKRRIKISKVQCSASDASKEKLMRAGLSLTSARITILEILAANRGSSLGAYDIYNIGIKNNYSLSVSSVYPTLRGLIEAGLVVMSYSGARKHFMLKENNNSVVRCIRCDAFSNFDSVIMSDLVKDALKEMNFSTRNSEFSIGALCIDCVDGD